MRLIHVAVPVPTLGALTYAVPDGLPDPAPGARVLVPLGKRMLTGVVVSGSVMRDAGSVGASDPGTPDPSTPDPRPPDPSTPDPGSRIPDPGGVRDVARLLDTEPFLPSDVLRLIEWVADYYACGIGEAAAAAMPPRT